jgi:hypothetical protein
VLFMGAFVVGARADGAKHEKAANSQQKAVSHCCLSASIDQFIDICGPDSQLTAFRTKAVCQS